MKFNSGFDFDELLGEDILNKLNISLTGVAYQLDSENESDMNNTIVGDAQIFENANIEAVTKYEPDNSPADHKSPITSFRKYKTMARKDTPFKPLIIDTCKDGCYDAFPDKQEMTCPICFKPRYYVENSIMKPQKNN
ncbi:hypothetical protein BD770DRAFT_409167 [Pilaira anomala]|nr:hypothetical protein BD770DRAFT_409167 [Pilaira anomala]